jgi:hypothetical protein
VITSIGHRRISSESSVTCSYVLTRKTGSIGSTAPRAPHGVGERRRLSLVRTTIVMPSIWYWENG